MKRAPLDDAAIGDLLRHGDPLAGDSGPGAVEVAAMRCAVLDATASPRRRSLPLTWTAALATTAAVCLLLLPPGRAPLPEDTGGRAGIDPGLPPAVVDATGPEDAGSRRQIRFTTPGGTRVVWTVDPELEL